MAKGFSTFYNEVMYNKNLTTTDKAVFMALSTFCYNGKNTCFPSYKTIGEMLGLSTRTIGRSIKKFNKIIFDI